MAETAAEIPMSGGGHCDAYVARSPRGPAPAVVLIPAIFGATPGIQEFARKLAAEGFEVIVPDLFWRVLPGPLGYEGTDREKAQDRYKRFDVEKGIADLRDIMAWSRASSSNGKVGIVGLCFGGRYAVLAAADLGAAAAVSFHGTFIGKHLDALPRLKCPTGLHFGEADSHAPMSEVNAIVEASASNRNVEVFTYPAAVHGFMQQDRSSYLPQAAELAFSRALKLLKDGLQ